MSDEIHIATKDKVGDYDAIETAKPGEPLFPIQGGDPLGPPTVLHWVELARGRARAILNGELVDFKPTKKTPEYLPTAADIERAEKLLTKATAAEMVAWAMKDYQRGGVEELPGERASYNEAETLPTGVLSKHEERRILITMVGTLNNALSIANDAAEKLNEMNLHPAAAQFITVAVMDLRKAAEAIEPRRGMERS